MKTLILILGFVVIVKSTPVANHRNIDVFWPGNKFPETISRQKKSSGHEVPTLAAQNFEDPLKTGLIESTTEDKFKAPLVIKKTSLSTSEEEKFQAVEKCKQVRFNLCDGEKEPTNMRATSLGTMDRLISEKEMEDSIKLAKEAMENLQKDIHKIEQSSKKSHSDDTNLHTKIEVARQALDNIHQNFENLETINGLAIQSKEPATETKLDDKKRSAMWKEMVDNVQKTGGLFKKAEDITNTDSNNHNKNLLKMTDTTLLEESDHLPSTDTLALKNDIKEESKNTELKSVQLNEDSIKNTLNGQENDSIRKVTLNLEPHKSKYEKDEASIKTSSLEKENIVSPHKVTQDSAKGNNPDKGLENNINQEAKPTPQNASEFHVTSINKDEFVMSKSELEAFENAKKHQRAEINEGNAEIKLTTEMPHFKEKTTSEDKLLSDALRMHSSQGNKLKNLQLTPVFPKTESEIQNQRLELHTAQEDHPTDQQTLREMKVAEFKQSQMEDINIGQSTNQNFEFGFPEQHTFEDQEFMRLAHEKQNIHLPSPLQSLPKFHNENLKASLMDEHLHHMTDFNPHSRHHDLSGHEDLMEQHMHDHMNTMRFTDMDSSVQPSMYMQMRDPYSRSAMEYNTMQWGHPSMARMSYGPAPPAPSPTPNEGSNAGAVGVFPNANVGPCAIPLLLSCSPSLVSGSLAKPASAPAPAPAHSFSSPAHSYRTGEDLSYYMKRDTKANDEFPVLKVLRTNTPFNHKNELTVDRKLR